MKENTAEINNYGNLLNEVDSIELSNVETNMDFGSCLIDEKLYNLSLRQPSTKLAAPRARGVWIIVDKLERIFYLIMNLIKVIKIHFRL